MVAATLFTQTTRFTYTFAALSASNGLGARVAIEVVGYGTTTVTLDLAAGNRILAEETITGTTRYLYGKDCLGELRDGAWLYYLPDAEGLVRQGTDAQGEVASAWLFDPDGAVLEGPDGPVSHLVCGGVYDQSTGLLYKGGRYFDPSLGIWLALLPLIVVRRKKKRRGYPWVVVLALCLGGMSGVLTACGGGGEQIDWEEIEEAICVEIPPDEFRTSQNVDIHHVSGPNATVYGGFEWRVRFELESPASDDGWIIQEINEALKL